jgi:hypothetical protein
MQHSNENKVVGNCLAQFCVTAVVQQSFHVALFDLQFKTTAFFYETIVSSVLISSVYDLP